MDIAANSAQNTLWRMFSKSYLTKRALRRPVILILSAAAACIEHDKTAKNGSTMVCKMEIGLGGTLRSDALRQWYWKWISDPDRKTVDLMMANNLKWLFVSGSILRSTGISLEYSLTFITKLWNRDEFWRRLADTFRPNPELAPVSPRHLCSKWLGCVQLPLNDGHAQMVR
jgi:hypothetical protein